MRISAFLFLGAVTLTACGGSDGTGIPPLESPPATRAAYYSWMHPDVERAWGDGFLGQGTRITVVDDFMTPDTIGSLGGGNTCRSHGTCVELIAGMIAPETQLEQVAWDWGNSFSLRAGQLNVINLSYGRPMPRWQANAGVLGRMDGDLVKIALEGTAVVVKAAGNDAIAVDATVPSGAFSGSVDGLNIALIDGQSHIFVGALSRNGTVDNPADLADYSNFAGSNTAIQEQFLTVGVDSARMGGLAGTSFAAPIVSGYAAILGSKFPDASPEQIVNQLLNEARTDTIRNYDPARHGRGEASILDALAPISLE